MVPLKFLLFRILVSFVQHKQLRKKRIVMLLQIIFILVTTYYNPSATAQVKSYFPQCYEVIAYVDKWKLSFLRPV